MYGAIDKLDLKIAGGVKLKPKFAKHWGNPDNDTIFKKYRSGGRRLVEAGELGRAFPGVDARLTVGNPFHDNWGAKLEIRETAKKGFSDFVGIFDEIFDGDACLSEVLRGDLKVDVPGVPVPEFERSMYVQRKQTRQTEYDAAQPPGVDKAYGRRDGQTLYFGRGDGQVRIYDKLAELKFKLVEANKQRTRQGQRKKTFAEENGFDPIGILTRVEEQSGGRLFEPRYGVRVLGELHKLADARPFKNFRFATDGKGEKELNELDPLTRCAVMAMREYVKSHSAVEAREFLCQVYVPNESRTKASVDRLRRRFIQKYEHLFLRPAIAMVGTTYLVDKYRESVRRQLAA